MDVLGLNAKTLRVVKVSDNLTRLIITTDKANDYAVYHYKNDGKMFANWKEGFITGNDKEKILTLMNDKRYNK
jgi:hypothetical protein